MLFNSIDFAILLPIVFLLYWFVFTRTRTLQNAFLVGVGYFFYAYRDWRFLSPIIISSAVDYYVGVGFARVGSQDDETLDGFHGPKIAYLRLMLKMAETSRILDDYVDAGQFEEMLDGIHGALEISGTDGAEA